MFALRGGCGPGVSVRRLAAAAISRSLALLPLLSPWVLPGGARADETVARQWNRQCLAAIRIDFPAPTVHARNLFHLSAAMYDAWAAYDGTACGFLHHEKPPAPVDVAAARDEAISYAAYRLLTARYSLSVNAATTQAALNARMAALGFDSGIVDTAGDSPAALGNRIAASILAFGSSDGANEAAKYVDPFGYTPANSPLILALSGTTMANPNRWQPLAFDVAFTQNGLVADKVQIFVGSHWRHVVPFALKRMNPADVYLDPGPPPLLGGEGDAEFKANNVAVIRFSSRLDPSSGDVIDISPGARGNNPLGTNNGTGHPINPVTGAPYAANPVKHGDFGRVVAEYWADGPHSETPPGHWNVIANTVTDHPLTERRIGGAGPVLDPLEWEVKLYLAMNGALHDAAVAAWNAKRNYDYVRPISSIRFMGGRGQSSDPLGPSYHPQGLPLTPGLVEVVTLASSAPGERHAHLAAHVGKIAIFTWPGEPADPATQFSGVRWILARDWLPYQRDTFVTPAFAGYISGHSTFSRAAAEVLTGFTGSPFFPGGLAEHVTPAGALAFEFGPSEDVTLQWATYYDAADEAGISRLYGGIHVAADDGPGRIVGSQVGIAALAKAQRYFDGSVLDEPPTDLVLRGAGNPPELRFMTVPGFVYQAQRSTDLRTFENLGPSFVATRPTAAIPDPEMAESDQVFYRVVRSPAPAE